MPAYLLRSSRPRVVGTNEQVQPWMRTSQIALGRQPIRLSQTSSNQQCTL